jgi:transposase-like protein
MDAKAPTVIDIPVSCAPKKAPCPTCGTWAERVRIGQREVRTIAYQKIARFQITYGEYQARCGCCTTFRTSPEGVEPRAKYDNKVRQAVVDRIIDDGLNVEATIRSLKRDFLLDLSTGFVYDCLRGAVAELDMAEHRERVLREFSGTLCIDELHLGRFTLLLATDPLSDLPVAFALVETNDAAHLRRFLKNLVNHGLKPKVIVTDGSPLYPKVLAELWPKAEHQLCVFHVMQDLNQKVLDAVKRMRRTRSRRGNRGRKRKRGRPTKAQQRRRQRETEKEKAQFVFKHRHLIVKRRDHLTDPERQDLKKMLTDLPELQPLRDFADAIQGLFAVDQSEHQAWCRWRALRANARYQAIPELKAALAMLEEKKFRKMIAFLRSPLSRRVRTNNHVERCNRKLRYWEKVRYKWRRRRTLVQFLVLALNHWWEKIWSSRPETETKLPGGRKRRKRVKAVAKKSQRTVRKARKAAAVNDDRTSG